MQKKRKVFSWYVLFVLLLALAVQFTWLPSFLAQQQEEKKYEFEKSGGISISVLESAAFQEKFAENQLIPKTNDAVLELAGQLYTVQEGEEALAELAPEEIEECGEQHFGALFAALSNPDITDETRDAVDNLIAAAVPSLPKTHTSTHFKFLYTTNDVDANHNVTDSDIQKTADIMEASWSDFESNFKVPKHYTTGGGCSGTKQLVDVKVYDLPGAGLYGSTSSFWDYIKLDSKLVVKDNCKRQTTPVHELFHRVQYSYGYITGTANLAWAVEATASWSQKYRAAVVGDWMTRMKAGLNNPDRQLIGGRSYDACHFWVYLGQRGNNEAATIKEVWSTFETNGKNMKNAVQTTIINRVPNGSSFDQFVGWWAFTNFVKDLSNAETNFDYAEDELTKTCGTRTYGPLASVPFTADPVLNVGTNFTTSDAVDAYGADYYKFSIGSNVQKVEIKVTATSNNFGYAIVEIKNNTKVTHQRTPGGGNQNFDFSKTFSVGQLTHIVLIVIGNPGGGNYTVTAKGEDIPS